MLSQLLFVGASRRPGIGMDWRRAWDQQAEGPKAKHSL
jgi:hypothetical protein